MSGLRLVPIDSAAALRDIAPAWWSLFRRCGEATPFQSPAWLLAWWEAFAPGPLAGASVWSGGELVGLALLWRERRPEGDRLLPLGIGVSDVQDILVDAGGSAMEAAQCLADAISGSRLPVLWTDLPPGARALELLPPGTWHSEGGDGESCPTLSWQSQAEAAPALRDLPPFVPSNRRRKWRMAGHRCDRRGIGEGPPVTPEAVPLFMAELERLHALRWRSRGEDGVLADPAVGRFHRLALPALLHHGLADLDWLWLQGECVAAYYGLRDGRSAYAYLGGFDPACEREGPGTLLLGRAILRAATSGATTFSFLRGREAYKYAWGATDRPSRWMRWTPPETTHG